MKEDEHDGSIIDGGEDGHEELIGLIRAVPRHRPRPTFRARVWFATTFPRATEPRERTAGGVSWSTPLGVAAMACLIVLLLGSGFVGLSVAARDSRPGDVLYGVKRANERIQMAFTWDESGKANEYVRLAGVRLTELETMAEGGTLDRGKLESTAADYRAKVSSATALLRTGNLTNREGVASKLNALESRKQGLLAAIEGAQPSGLLQGVAGAAVTVEDRSGSGSLGQGADRVSGVTDSGGEFRFTLDAAPGAGGPDLTATVEKDASTSVVPLFEDIVRQVKVDGEFTVKVEPALTSVTVGRPQRFTLTLCTAGNRPVSGKRLNLRDSSGTSTINGMRTGATVVTDGAGRCSFTITKSAASPPTRVAAVLENGEAKDLGEVLVLEGVEQPAPSSGTAVTAQVTGSDGGTSGVRLDNGLVTVSCGGGGDIASITGCGMTGELIDPLEASSNGGLEMSGPVLNVENKESAGYEVVLEMALAGGSVRKAYQVTLSAGRPYASVECRISVAGDAASVLSQMPSTAEACAVRRPAGSVLRVSGEDVPGVAPGTMYSFELTRPYFTFDDGNGTVMLACPLGSDAYPDSWAVGDGYVGAHLRTGLFSERNEVAITTLLGAFSCGSQEEVLDSLLLKADTTAAAPPGTADTAASGELVVTTEPATRAALRDGRQEVVLKVSLPATDLERYFE